MFIKESSPFSTRFLKSYRPPQPRMMNNFHRGPMPHNNQWRPNQGPRPPPRFSMNNQHFGAAVMRTENSEDHWCETCDRGFPTADLLQKHNQQHQKCNIDGCQFIAHPKVITKHIQMQHSTGLFKKIANLNNPEDIQKWREERKKKYPTKSNIEKKNAECKEKIERGEKMALNRDYRNNKHGSTAQGYNLKRKHSFDKKDQNQRMIRQNFKNNSSMTTNSQPAKKKPRAILIAPATSEKNKLKPFAGIVNIEMDQNAEDISEPLECSNGLFEDDEETLVNPLKTTDTQKPVLCGALTSLMCNYGSSDEELEEKENEVINKLSVMQPCQKPEQPPKSDNSKINMPAEDKPKINMPVEDKPKIVENKENDDEGPEEVKIVKTNVEHDTAPETIIKTKEKPVKNIMPPRKPNRQNYKLKRKIPSTLLQKLLHNEIRQERNIVLQCIRYIKKCNYFEKLNQ